ncbi:transglutaminase [Clostridium sp. Bc-iso-3]|nr:transglutaminase [Clostridium sp. Bc-iso-3]
MDSKRFLDYFAGFVLAVLMSFSLVYPLTTTLSFPYSYLHILGLVTIILFICSILFINRSVSKISVPLAISSLAAGTIFLAVKGDLEYIIQPFGWLIKYINDEAILPGNYYPFFITIVLALTLSLFVFIFTMNKFNFIIIALVGIIIYVSQWMLDFFMASAYISFYTFVVSILAYYFMHIYKKKCLESSNNDFASPSGFILGIVPLCVLIVFLTNSIPVRSKPIEWKWMDDKINNFYNRIGLGVNSRNAKGFDADYFSFYSSGFGNDDNLGGNIVPNNIEIMDVTTDRSIYLRGRACDLYSGSTWTSTELINSSLSSLSKMSLDITEMKTGLPFLADRIDPDNNIFKFSETDEIIPDIISKHNVKVKYENIRTKSLFVPLKSENFYFPSNIADEVIIDQEGIFTSNKFLNKNFTYSFDSYSLNTASESFNNLLRQSTRGLYGIELNALTDEAYEYFYNRYLKDLLDEAESAYNSDHEILNRYSVEFSVKNIIRNTPDNRTLIDLLNEYLVSVLIDEYNLDSIFGGENLNFYILMSLSEFNDSEYLKKLDQLKSLNSNSGYIYNTYLKVPYELPQRVKDLAISITDSETNNFDRAKAIEKYLSANYSYTLTPGDTPADRDFVDYFLFEKKEGYCVYFASSMVILARSIGLPARYVEGFVLPTKSNEGVYEITNQQAHAWPEIYFEGFGWVAFEPTPVYHQDSFYSFGGFRHNTSGMNPQATTGLQNQNNDDGNKPDMVPQPVESQNPFFNTLLIIAIVIGLLVFLILIIVGINKIRRKHKLKSILNMPPKEAVIKLYEIYLNHLLYQYMPVRPGETPLEYAKRLDDYGYFSPKRFIDVATIFVKARYSQNEVTETDMSNVLEFYEPTVSKTRSSMGKIKYFLLAHILGRI